jgi:phospholipase/lecithinase/hemolysin
VTIRRIMLSFLLLILVSIPALAAKTYDAIYVFGDSYCDVGNIFLATHGAVPPSPPYYQGRFSNGPLWVEHLANALHLPLTPALAGGTDYAVGGAEVLQSVPAQPQNIPSVPQQVAGYLLQHGGHADPNALYILEGGGNDIIHATGINSQRLGVEIAAGIAGSELLLRQAGARNFFIPNLLNVGQLPIAQSRAGYAKAATIATNVALHNLLALESRLQGVTIFRADAYQIFRSIAEDPSHLGFANVATPCLNVSTGAVCSDPARTLFWDAEHPTTFGHSFLAIAAETVILQ